MSQKYSVRVGDFDFELTKEQVTSVAVSVLEHLNPALVPLLRKEPNEVTTRLLNLATAGTVDPKLLPLLEAEKGSVFAAAHVHKKGESAFLILSNPGDDSDAIGRKLEAHDSQTFEMSVPDAQEWVVVTPGPDIYDLRD